MFAAVLILGGAWLVLSNLLDILAGLTGFKGLDVFLGYWGAILALIVMLKILS